MIGSHRDSERVYIILAFSSRFMIIGWQVKLNLDRKDEEPSRRVSI